VGADVSAALGVAPRTAARTDATIIAESLAEPENFALIYARHASTVYRYAHRRLGSAYAEDLVSDTFVAAFQARATYDPSRPDARPWLLGIATRKIARWHRAEQQRYRLLARAVAGDAVDGPADRVTDAVSAQAVRPALAAALAGLAARDRDVLLLAAWGDLTYEEIATTLAIAVGTVRSRLNRARRKVRAALRDDVRFTAGVEER
jgi:RNA polymerase sigma-70 factor (ECF subfamily)